MTETLRVLSIWFPSSSVSGAGDQGEGYAQEQRGIVDQFLLAHNGLQR